MIVLDTNALVRWMIAAEGSDDEARFAGLVDVCKKASLAIGIPTPVFAEFLVRTDEATTPLLQAFERKRSVRLLPFDKRCAHECALLDRAALASRNKRAGSTDAWQKVKIDRQIIAIARVNGVTRLISEDGNLKGLAARVGIEATAVDDLPIPDAAKQLPISFSAAAAAHADAPPPDAAPGP